MKKLLVLMLVFGMASLASATVILSGPDVDPVEGTSYDLGVSGTAEDAPGSGIAGGVYALPQYNTLTAYSGVGTGLGNLGAVTPYDDGFFNGWDFTVGALGAVEPDDFVAANWSVGLSYIAGAVGTSQEFGLFDYAVSFNDPVAVMTVNFVPEPMTMVLLGLGGLFLRRRK